MVAAITTHRAARTPKPSRRSDWDGVLIPALRPCSERVHRVEPVRHLARLTVALRARAPQ
jgi:hypothetical protein